MHELSVCSGIIEVAEAAIGRLPPPPPKVGRVDVRIGRLTGLVPETLRHYYGLLTVGTALEGSRLAIEVVPVRGRCGDCGSAVEIEEFRFTCPSCGGGLVEVRSGRELEVVSLETVDDVGAERTPSRGN